MKGSPQSNDVQYVIEVLEKEKKVHVFVNSLTVYAAIYFHFRGITTLKLNGKESDDIVHDALVRVLEGRRNWRLPEHIDRNNTRSAIACFKIYMKSVIRGIVSHELKKAQLILSSTQLSLMGSGKGLDEYFFRFLKIDGYEELSNEDKCRYFLTYFKEDLEAVRVLKVIFYKSIYRTIEIANELKKTPADVRNIKRRIKRKLEKLGFPGKVHRAYRGSKKRRKHGNR